MRILLLLSSWILPALLFGQSVPTQEMDAYFSQMVKDWDVPSASIAIVKDGQVVFSGQYGVKSVEGSEVPDDQTLYAIASNTKAFTTMVIGMLVEDGVLHWDDKVRDHLPYFAMHDSQVSDQVTISDLLCHRVGLGTFSGDVIWYKSELNAEDIIRRIRHLPLAYDFRAGYGYSNLMYITAGKLIEEVTGKSWHQNIRERILTPLGMSRTISTTHDLDRMGNFATPHARVEGNNLPIAWENWETIAATGGIITSASDLAKWLIFNLDHGVHEGDTLISAATRNLLWTPHNNFVVDHTQANPVGQHFRSYGLGWGLSDYRGRLRVGHTGGYDGMISITALIPDEKLGVTILTNGMQSPIRAATNYALDMMLEGASKDWSEEVLTRVKVRKSADVRVAHRKVRRIPETRLSSAIIDYSGTYHSKIYGDITVTSTDDEIFRLEFEHSPALAATLEHWHYDVWKINWDQPHAWFDFGTVRFITDNNQKVIGLDFDVPNDDIFFEELKPVKVSTN